LQSENSLEEMNLYGGSRRRFFDAGNEPFANLSAGILAIPIQLRRQRGIVSVSCWWLLLFELRLYANIGPQQRLRLSMLII
jgi:hypothetical protein